MNIIERAKNILITPRTEWLVVKEEGATLFAIMMKYVLPFALLSSIGKIIESFFSSPTYGPSIGWTAGIDFISIIIAFYISVIIIDMLAKGFDSEKNQGKSAQLVAYSNTPVWMAGCLILIPGIGVLLAIASWIYSIYLFYMGIGLLKKTPEDKRVVYMVVSVIIMHVVLLVISAILNTIFSGA